jgi:hypothetical protein
VAGIESEHVEVTNLPNRSLKAQRREGTFSATKTFIINGNNTTTNNNNNK